MTYRYKLRREPRGTLSRKAVFWEVIDRGSGPYPIAQRIKMLEVGELIVRLLNQNENYEREAAIELSAATTRETYVDADGVRRWRR